MWTWFKDFIFMVLQFFADHLGDWGLSIIVVTIILRIILMPLTLKQQKSMAHMQQLQPKLKALQERYKDDPQRLNQEMMKFYSENKFNPAAGCLPILIQMPVFIALFQVLSSHIQSGATLLNMINLTATPQQMFTNQGLIAALPYIIMVLLFGTLTLIPMYMQQNVDKNIKIMSVVMGVMMLWFGWLAPTGVLLYWDTSAFWGLIQQFIITKKVKHQAAVEEAAKKVYEPIEVNVVRQDKKARPKKKK